MLQNKKMIEEEIKRKKYLMLNNLDKIMRNPGSFSPEKLRKIFPEDNEINEIFTLFKSNFESNEENLHPELNHKSSGRMNRSLHSTRSENEFF
jgi:hypothetical protein